MGLNKLCFSGFLTKFFKYDAHLMEALLAWLRRLRIHSYLIILELNQEDTRHLASIVLPQIKLRTAASV